MKIVIDCNVIISAAINNGNCRKILKYVILNCSILVSDNILKEYFDVSQRKKHKKYCKYILKILSILSKIAYKVESPICNYELPDRDDEVYLWTALSWWAKYLITWNIKDFPEKKYWKVIIINPRDFVDKYLT